MSSYDKVEGWLNKDARLLGKYQGERCTAAVIYHEKASKKGVVVGEIPIPPSDIDPPSVTVLIFEAAEEDARNLGRSGPQTYYFRLRYGPKMAPARCSFRVVADSEADPFDDDDDDVSPSEPATSAGVAGSSMRHVETLMKLNEGLTRTVTGAFTAILNAQTRQIETLMQGREKSDSARLEALELVSEVIAGREVTRAQEEREKEQMGMRRLVADKVMTLAGPVAMKWLGTGAGSEAGIAVSLLGLAKSLKPEQLGAIMGALTNEQAMAFGMVLETVEKYAKENGVNTDDEKKEGA